VKDIGLGQAVELRLPPSAHTTFVTRGAVVCSFPPRPLEQDPEALRAPFFFTATADYDEFLMNHDGGFFSRDNMKAGTATLYPLGSHHGPHPRGAGESEEEIADGRVGGNAGWIQPDSRFPAGESVEWLDYWQSLK